MVSDTLFKFSLFNFVRQVFIKEVVDKVKNRIGWWYDSYINSISCLIYSFPILFHLWQTCPWQQRTYQLSSCPNWVQQNWKKWMRVRSRKALRDVIISADRNREVWIKKLIVYNKWNKRNITRRVQCSQLACFEIDLTNYNFLSLKKKWLLQ